ncbi:septin family protein [Gymnopilus junonius]|uniref:Septin family protein n=1 Tax=Gymnopilus junonius TaxID=109634 RepID=A0A9P5NQQ2_GYMJU|nr:septin family protein [Gymnopilus junonius]
MFSFRRKPRREPESPRIRTSPSLPELNSQGIPWPEELVDIAAIRQESPPDAIPHQGAARVSFQSHSAIPFHKPFRPSTGKPNNGGPISDIYMSGPPATFDKKVLPPLAGRFSQRRARIPPTFNIMVAGGKGTGKTSILRLLLETADISPGATVDQKAAVDRFLKGSTKATQDIQTACVEICESRFDRVLFSVIDTPGLDFLEGRELKLERQVSSVIKYVDAQYADTMSEESKVVRQSKGDQHIHLCIYMIDPASIMTTAARHAMSSMPTKTRSETTVSLRTPPELVPDTSSGDESEDDEDGALTMSPAEIRVIRRLTARTNVLPVIARADSLTDEKLTAVKEAVRTGLSEAGIDFGIFGPTKKPDSSATPKRKTKFAESNDQSNGNEIPEVPEETESEGEEDAERKSRPVIKLRPSRHRALSRSRSRRDLSQVAEDERRPITPDTTDKESIANVRFSAHIVAKTDLSELLPFALIAPEQNKRRHRPVSMTESVSTATHQVPSEDSPDNEVAPQTPASIHSLQKYGFLHGPPEDLRGIFTRKFRWGTVDVLNPDHCDFAALRTAVLSTHLKVLKTHTKEVLYEKYRTEKLLARRATSHISDEERQRLLEDLGL